VSYQTIKGQQTANGKYQPTENQPTEKYQPTNEEHMEAMRRQEQQERAWLRSEALIQKIGQAYDEFTRLMQQFPEIGRQMTAGIGEDRARVGEANAGFGEGSVEIGGGSAWGNEGNAEKAYERGAQGRAVYERIRRESLALADAAPRCRWVKQDGTLCRCPQMKNDVYCFAHRQMREAHTLMLRLPAQEDANAIQIGLMQVQKALIEDRISTKKAGLLLYSMQLALQNVGQVTFGQAKDEEMLTETVTEQEAFREIGSSGDRDILPQPAQNRRGPGTPDIGRSERQTQDLFTTENREATEKIGSSGQREIGSSERQKQTPTTEAQRHGGEAEDIEFVPMAGGYGFHRMRLRIGDEGRPVQVAAAQRKAAGTDERRETVLHGHAEPHANLG
jgi:hypothetical protein